MSTEMQRELEELTASMKVSGYVIEIGKINQEIYNFNEVPEYLILKEEEEAGLLYGKNPHLKNPNIGNFITPAITKKALIGVTGPDGNFLTKNAWHAHIGLQGGLVLNAKACVSRFSKPLTPEAIEKDKQETLKRNWDEYNRLKAERTERGSASEVLSRKK